MKVSSFQHQMSTRHSVPREGDSTQGNTLEYATRCDKEDPLHHLRSQFFIPSKKDLTSAKSARQGKKSVSFISLLAMVAL